MDLELSRLKQMFGPFPEPVLYLQEGQFTYMNPAVEARFPGGAPNIPSEVWEGIPAGGGETQWASEAGVFHVTVSPLEGGALLVLRPMQTPDLLQFSNIPARLRTHLANLSGTSEQLSQKLQSRQDREDYHALLSMQTRAIYCILRLAHQMELSQDNWAEDYPMGSVDLVLLCRQITYELQSRTGKGGPHVTLNTDLPALILSGNTQLLNQLILSLLSNAIKSATLNGTVELGLSQKQNKVILSVWDKGSGIPDDKLGRLFMQQSVQAPSSGDGSGLDLWLAHRIAVYHEGVIMAANHPEGGAELTVSLPIRPPERLRMRSEDHLSGTAFSPVLIGLSDVLPWQVYSPYEEN